MKIKMTRNNFKGYVQNIVQYMFIFKVQPLPA